MPLSIGIVEDKGRFVFQYYGLCAAAAAALMAVLAGIDFLSGRARR